MKLFISVTSKLVIGLVMIGALLFLPAGTPAYTYGWLFIGLLFVPMTILGLILLFKAPDLLKKRLNAKEKQAAQKSVLAFSALMFVSGFTVAGLDFRYGWSYMPMAVTVIASAVFLICYAIYAEVMRENAYLSRTVEVFEGQKVVDTGLYGIVRHPMYAVTLVMFTAIPVVLGSWWAILCFIPYTAIIAARILNEERVLVQELDGYREYMMRVKYRLIPFIW